MDLFMQWFVNPIRKVGFEDVLYAIHHPDKYIFINTLSSSEQDCLIHGTTSISREEIVINEILERYETKRIFVIIYGKNSADPSVDKKYTQLTGLGFTEVYIYAGGLFEWLLLQDIYGSDEFPTNAKPRDILKYRQARLLNVPRLGYFERG